MGFGEAISSCYSNYATFSGRASRSEYWFFQLFHFLLILACCIFILSGIGVVLLVLVAIVNFLPHLAVMVRRLHDTDHSGWWYWIALVPIVGAILLLVWMCTRGSWGENRFGPDPLSGEFPAPPPRSGFSPPPGDLPEQLAKLAKLRAEGTISEEEFQRLKTKLI